MWLLEGAGAGRQEALGDTGLQGGHKDRSGPTSPRCQRSAPTAAGLLCGDREGQEREVGVWWLGCSSTPPPLAHTATRLTRPREAAHCARTSPGARRSPGGAVPCQRQAGLGSHPGDGSAQAAGSQTLQRRDTHGSHHPWSLRDLTLRSLGAERPGKLKKGTGEPSWNQKDQEDGGESRDRSENKRMGKRVKGQECPSHVKMSLPSAAKSVPTWFRAEDDTEDQVCARGQRT